MPPAQRLVARRDRGAAAARTRERLQNPAGSLRESCWLLMKDIEETQGHAVNYPMIGDPELKVAKLYDMLPDGAGDSSEGRTAADNAPVRAVFFIGPDKKVKAMLTRADTPAHPPRVLSPTGLGRRIRCAARHSSLARQPSSADAAGEPLPRVKAQRQADHLLAGR